MVPIVDDDDIPLTWDPVPVPRPTYTMKAKAPRAEVAPAAVTPDPVPVVRESQAESYDERRVAGRLSPPPASRPGPPAPGRE